MSALLNLRHNNKKSFFTQHFERLASNIFENRTAKPQSEAEHSMGPKRNPKENNPVRLKPQEQKYLEMLASKSILLPEKLLVAKCKLRA
jgi:hypothetical protein